MEASHAIYAASAFLVLFVCAFETSGEMPTSTEQISTVSEKALKEGEELFAQNCNICHPDGGNIMKADKTLHKGDLTKNGITSAEDIVNIMRNPGPGMRKFGKDMISDKDARKIAEYILKTY